MNSLQGPVEWLTDGIDAEAVRSVPESCTPKCNPIMPFFHIRCKSSYMACLSGFTGSLFILSFFCGISTVGSGLFY